MKPKEFLKVRNECPWRKSSVKGRKPIILCRATDSRCMPDGCALAHWKEFYDGSNK
jgi:hypothetical protein